ncbi:MAG: phenylalanine--tRNA ligase subunit beta [Candidatus Eisenbacteria bacterium]|nr:phenylalanine--tRNA ligase subunit beta [Candidatus Eisenbacteria bacterium]
MKVSLAWLRDYVDFDMDAVELARRLTERLTETVPVRPAGADATGVVVAKIVTVDRHPDADSLSVCVVDWGSGSASVVCGAPNARAGLVTGLALPGAVIAGGRAIGEQTIRGRRSFGMLVSAAELGVSDDAAGIIELDPSSSLGEDIRSALALTADAVDVEVQPNRPDCTGIVGVAREVAAMTRSPLREPRVDLLESGTPASALTGVEILDPAGCPRYIARVIAGVKVGPSPAWLAERLESVGQRPINNVVDATNFAMLELGHPVHAFDFEALEGRRIVVRRASAGEELVTLDGVTRKLGPSQLVIADAAHPVALAGVMGGAGSEVTEGTTTVLLECACFDPVIVRRGARGVGLRTEASWRFERGVDTAAMDRVAARVCGLIASIAGGQVAPGAVDVGPGLPAPSPVTLRMSSVRRLLGDGVSTSDAAGHLAALGFGVAPDADALRVSVPSFRRDIELEADLVEEVTRSHGYENVASAVPFRGLDERYEKRDARVAQVRGAMVGLGFYEALTSSFTSPAVLERVGADPAAAPTLSNPINRDAPLLRPTAVPGLLDVVRTNWNVGEKDVRVFEIAKVFSRQGTATAEAWSLAGAMTGRAGRPAWDGQSRSTDFFDGKGALWALGEALGVDSLGMRCYDGRPLFDRAEGAVLSAGGREIGHLGMISRGVLDAWDLEQPVFVFELSLDELARGCRLVGKHERLPRYPKVRRDVALILDDGTPAAGVLDVVGGHGEALLQSVEVFDLYRGSQLPAGKKSLGLSLTYMSRERTLTDAEVDEAHGRVVNRLLKELGASLRK